jgi:hypothetical protein
VDLNAIDIVIAIFKGSKNKEAKEKKTELQEANERRGCQREGSILGFPSSRSLIQRPTLAGSS